MPQTKKKSIKQSKKKSKLANTLNTVKTDKNTNTNKNKNTNKNGVNNVLKERLTDKHKAKYLKQLKKSCNFYKKNKNLKVACDKLQNCNLQHCQDELFNQYATVLTNEDYKLCKNKDFKLEYKCIEDKRKVLKPYDHLIKLQHCEANKCEKEAKDFKEKLEKELEKELENIKFPQFPYTNTNTNCYKEKCPDGYKKSEDIDEYNRNLIFECTKKYDNVKDYEKCIKKTKKNCFTKINIIKITAVHQ